MRVESGCELETFILHKNRNMKLYRRSVITLHMLFETSTLEYIYFTLNLITVPSTYMQSEKCTITELNFDFATYVSYGKWEVSFSKFYNKTL